MRFALLSILVLLLLVWAGPSLLMAAKAARKEERENQNCPVVLQTHEWSEICY